MDQNPEEIGYQKPPRASQFKKGQSGNPKGRPKTEQKTLHHHFCDTLNEPLIAEENGKRIKITKAAALAKRTIALALNGDVQALRILSKMMPELQKEHLRLAEKTPSLINITFNVREESE